MKTFYRYISSSTESAMPNLSMLSILVWLANRPLFPGQENNKRTITVLTLMKNPGRNGKKLNQ
jgi:hypothetical protein